MKSVGHVRRVPELQVPRRCACPAMMLQRDDAIRIGFWTLIASPIWLPLLGFWMPPLAARRIRHWLGVVALATLLFAVANSSDQDTAQWPATFIFMASLFLYFAGILLTLAIDLRLRLQKGRRQAAADNTPTDAAHRG